MKQYSITNKKILSTLGDLFPKQSMLEKQGKNYINAIQGWEFSDETIKSAARASKLLHLDYEFSVNCSLDCCYCFRKNDNRDNGKILSFNEWSHVLNEAKELGVTSIKFLGAGELTENKNFFKAMEYTSNLEITPLIFTAANVIGDDNLSRKYHGMSGAEMAKKLYDMGCSIMVKANSFNPEIQDKIVGVKGYSEKRDEGLRRLINAGFNNHNPTRLGLEVAMMRTEPGELFEIYKLKEALNLYIDLDPFMPCGNTKTIEKSNPFDISLDEKIELYKKVYSFNEEVGIPFRGVSPYAGGQECSQLGYGLYINIMGEIFPCPGSHYFLGNVRGKNLEELWKKNSFAMKYSGALSHGCPFREEAGVLYPGWEKDVRKNSENISD